MIPGGSLHDLNAVAKHFYYEGTRNNSESQVPLAFMGACSVALGCSMLWTAWQKHQKFTDGLRKAGNAHAGHARQAQEHDRGR